MNFRPQRLGLGASTFSLSPFSASDRKGMGQTEQTLYSRAKSAVAEFDVLATGTTPSPADRALRDRISSMVMAVEASTPANYGVFSGSGVADEINKLENVNRNAKAVVEKASESEVQVDIPAPTPTLKNAILLTAVVGVLIWATLSLGDKAVRRT